MCNTVAVVCVHLKVFFITAKSVELYREKVTEILDRLQLKYEEEMEEIRQKIAVSVNWIFFSRSYD